MLTNVILVPCQLQQYGMFEPHCFFFVQNSCHGGYFTFLYIGMYLAEWHLGEFNKRPCPSTQVGGLECLLNVYHTSSHHQLQKQANCMLHCWDLNALHKLTTYNPPANSSTVSITHMMPLGTRPEMNFTHQTPLSTQKMNSA